MIFLRIKYKCEIFVIIFYLKMLMRPHCYVTHRNQKILSEYT